MFLRFLLAVSLSLYAHGSKPTYSTGTFVYARYYSEDYFAQFGFIPLDVSIATKRLTNRTDLSITDDALKEESDKDFYGANTKLYADQINSTLADAHFVDTREFELDVVTGETYVNNPAHEDFGKRKRKDDDKTYTRWVSDVVHYGEFANRAFKDGDVVGLYTGIIRDIERVWNTDYSWQYQWDAYYHDKETNVRIKPVMDSLQAGNAMRFVNHGDPEELNVRQRQASFNGQWVILYVAMKDIKPHEELLVSYGQSYWNSRKK